MRHRPNNLICNINVTGFSSVMLAVVFLFMYWQMTVGILSPHDGVGPDLPRVMHPVSMVYASSEYAMVVAITRDDKVFFCRDLVRPDQLPARIRESIGHGSEKKVYIRADGRAKYNWVAEVLDSVRSAGVEQIGFLVEQGKTPVSSAQ